MFIKTIEKLDRNRPFSASFLVVLCFVKICLGNCNPHKALNSSRKQAFDIFVLLFF